MTADDALREMRLHADNGMTIYANVAQQWADAIEAELKALREKVAMLEKRGHDPLSRVGRSE